LLEYLNAGARSLEETMSRKSMLGVPESQKDLALNLERFKAILEETSEAGTTIGSLQRM
jgi:hypothetical protein